MPVAVSYENDAENPVAGETAIHIRATDVDAVNETTNAEIRYYLSVEMAGYDAARSPVFSGDGEWDGFIFPVAGDAMIVLRKEEDDSVAAQLAVTVE
jgi:hypothetical protein